MPDLTFPAADGYALAGTLFEPAAPNGRTVLVAPATGVLRRIYAPFAAFLAAEGFRVLTWDWRGTGGSRPAGSLRGFDASLRLWAERDLAGAIDWAGRRHPGDRVVAVGHSFGGQAMGLAPNANRLGALVTVASQSGYWGLWPRPARWRYALLWYAAMPLATRLFGYFPARLFGLGEDLPAGVALQWARWCRRPSYMGDAWAGHRAITAPLLAYSFDDDPFAPLDAAAEFYSRFGSHERRHRHLTPAEAGTDRVGHWGFFREGRMPALWSEAAEWLGTR